jgi:hypothetical protein
VAAWCESVAAHLRPRHALSTWDRFYDDLAQHFEYAEEVLAGRRLLLDEDRALRLCGKARDDDDLSNEPVVFFQPKARSADEDDMDEEVDVAIPTALKRAVCFMHPDLSWHTQEGATRRNKPSRDFFRNSGLIQPYKTRALLDRLADVLASTGHHGVHAAALRWLFNLDRATHIDPEFLATLPIRVPTRVRWRKAQDAFFGKGWDSVRGGELEVITSDGRRFSESLAKLNHRLIQPPTAWPHQIEQPKLWRAFLERLGVREGLWPVSSGPGVKLPGLAESAQPPDAVRQPYASLVVAGLGDWDDAATAALSRALSSAAWLPIAETDGAVGFSTPEGAWHIDYGDRVLSGVPVLTRPIRKALTTNGRALDRLTDLGLAVWGRVADSADQLALQGELLAAGAVDDAELPTFRSSYKDAWEKAGQLDVERPFGAYEHLNLVVMTGGSIDTLCVGVGADNDGDPIYVQDVDDELTAHLLEGLGQPVLLSETGSTEAARILASALGARVRAVSDAQVSIFVDGQPFEPSAEAPRLAADSRAWLPTFVACTIEFQTDRFVRISDKQREAALTLLERARVVAATDLRAELDGAEVKPPTAIALEDERFPTLITTRPTADLSLEELAELAPYIADLIGLERLRSELELSLGRFARAIQDEGGSAIDDAALAAVFQVAESRILEVRRWVEGAVGPLLELLFPVVAHLVGMSAAAELDRKSQGATSIDDVAKLVDGHANALPLSVDELLMHCQEAGGLADLRDRLGLDYAGFNATLDGLGPPYGALIDLEAHERAFEAFKQENREPILGSLRTAYLDDFRAGRSLDRYVGARSLDAIGPDPEWLAEMAFPSDDRMTERIDTWLATHGAETMRSQTGLIPRDEVVQRNVEVVDRLAERLRDIIPVWCVRNDVVAPAPWHARDEVPERMRDLFGQAGILEFEPVEEEKLIAHLVESGAWPAGMPATADLDRLGLAADELAKQENARDQERREREFKQRSIELGDTRLEASRENYLEIARLVRASITEDFLGTTSRRTRLEQFPPAQQRDASPRGARPRSPRRTEPTPLQREAIGFVGEVAAFEWLRVRYPGVTADNWKSSYREVQYPGAPGDDSLGYDFEVAQRTQVLYFEVKAGGDATQFEFGESQVRMAGACARRDNYRILFVRHALEPDRRCLLVLPNPVSARGRDLFRPMGGLSYEFRLPS